MWFVLGNIVSKIEIYDSLISILYVDIVIVRVDRNRARFNDRKYRFGADGRILGF